MFCGLVVCVTSMHPDAGSVTEKAAGVFSGVAAVAGESLPLEFATNSNWEIRKQSSAS